MGNRQTPARKVVRGVPDLYISEDPGGEQADPGQEGGEGRHAHRAAHTGDGVGHRCLPETPPYWFYVPVYYAYMALLIS